MTHNRNQILELMDRHGLRASRALGQNFMTDANSVRRIARFAGVGPGDHVVEVGAGLGSLSLALAESGASVTALEVDRHLVPALREVMADRVQVIQGDALKVDWSEIADPAHSWVVVANLPYNVGTKIVTHLLDDVPQVQRLVVLLQKEVAQRLAAGVGDDAYGALSVKIRYHGDARILGVVPPTVFVPKPDVESALVEITRLPAVRVDPSVVSAADLFRIVNTAFGKRRKMLRATLGAEVPESAYEAAGIAPTARPEELDVADWGRLISCSRR